MNEQTIWPELPYWPEALMIGGILGVIIISICFFLWRNDNDIGQ